MTGYRREEQLSGGTLFNYRLIFAVFKTWKGGRS